MQPGPPPEYPQRPPSGQQPVAGWPPAPGRWGTPEAAPTAAAPAPVPVAAQGRAGRPGLVLLVAVLVEIIVIAAADNQWVGERVSDAALNHPGSLGYDFAFALLTFQWRFSPAPGDRLHSLYGQWALLAVLIVVSALLVLLVARGRAGFARVFFGSWAAVIAATGLGAIVRAAVVDGRLLQGKSRFQYALFSDIGPSQYVFVAGLGLGLVVGLAAGLTAVAARRDEDAAAPVPVTPPVAARQPDARADAQTTQFERTPADQDATRQFSSPAYQDPAEQFRSPRDVPRESEATQAISRETPAEPEPTQAMPRVDEERPER